MKKLKITSLPISSDFYIPITSTKKPAIIVLEEAVLIGTLTVLPRIFAQWGFASGQTRLMLTQMWGSNQQSVEEVADLFNQMSRNLVPNLMLIVM
ncbi:hypothetical protein OIU76_021421 [Salix suchowensis]|nr:hypothetical protein OIU76_021421 [Salix suchowensis]